MTICIAAIYDKGIVAITDLQRTDLGTLRKNEAPVSKVYPFVGNKVIALLAGDMALQSELCEATAVLLESRFPDQFTVKEVVDCFVEAHTIARQKRISRHILGDYGLTWDEYLEGQKRRSRVVNETILRRIESFEMPWGEDAFSTIIAGLDRDGAHIWKVDEKDCYACSDVAFASIGIGSPEADIQMQKAEYSKHLPYGEALFLTYVAKARAEVYEGIGTATAVCAITQDMGLKMFDPNLLIPVLYHNYEKMEDELKMREQVVRRLVGLQIDSQLN